METIHFAAIEAGRVTPLCGGRGTWKHAWTTKHDTVTCARCRSLLSESDALSRWLDAEPAAPRADCRP